MTALPPWSALAAVHDHFAHTAADLCNAGQDVSPQLFVVELAAEGQMERTVAMPPDLLANFYSSDGGKDLLALFMRQALTPGSNLRTGLAQKLGVRPDVLVQVTEVWLATGPDMERLLSSGRIRDLPSRQEAVLVALHLPELTIPVVHPIKTKPRRCERAPFPLLSDLPAATGRFLMQDGSSSQGPKH